MSDLPDNSNSGQHSPLSMSEPTNLSSYCATCCKEVITWKQEYSEFPAAQSFYDWNQAPLSQPKRFIETYCAFCGSLLKREVQNTTEE